MIVVTGSSGFIGKNLVKKLISLKGKEFIVGVDFIPSDLVVTYEPYKFLDLLRDRSFSQKIETIFHNGACSSTTNYDVPYMMKNNFDYSVSLLAECLKRGINLIYASSASVYGDGPFHEDANHDPKNVYAFTKSMFDRYVDKYIEYGVDTQIVGLRYFNVYGPEEHNKGDMSSVIYKFFNQKIKGKINLFKGSENFKRDFIYVEDVVDINLEINKSGQSGIYNVGTGQLNSFLDIAKIFENRYGIAIKEIEMPEKLKGKYQKYTLSDNTKIKKIIDKNYLSLDNAVNKYLDILES